MQASVPDVQPDNCTPLSLPPLPSTISCLLHGFVRAQGAAQSTLSPSAWSEASAYLVDTAVSGQPEPPGYVRQAVLGPARTWWLCRWPWPRPACRRRCTRLPRGRGIGELAQGIVGVDGRTVTGQVSRWVVAVARVRHLVGGVVAVAGVQRAVQRVAGAVSRQVIALRHGPKHRNTYFRRTC